MMNTTTILTDDNITIKSIHDEIPTFSEYYSNLTTFTTISIIIGILLFILNVITFILTVSECRKRIRKQYLNCTLIMIGIYPILSGAALITILYPKSVFICHTVMHLSFVIGAVVFYHLSYLYVDGMANFLKENDNVDIELKTPPCCYCCIWLHPMVPTKTRLTYISYLIYQFPFIQFLIMISLNIIYVHEVEIFTNSYLFLAPFMIISILLAIWGLNIITKMIGSFLTDYNMHQKFICIQLVLILCKLQFGILNYSLGFVDFGGEYPITNTVYKQGIINLLILLEMFPLALFAKWAYKMPTYL